METKEQQASRLFNTACECIKSEKYKEAYNYLTRSSKLSNADARYILGIWLLFGVDCINLEQQIPEAIFCLIKSANKGNICSKNLLNTFLEIDDIEELGKEDIKDIVHLMNEKETKDNAIKNFIKENKCKILNAINNLCIIRPIIKTEQLELNKTTPLEQHNNVSIEYNEHEKHDEFESRQITQSITKENISSKHNKEKADEFKPKHIHNQINDKYLLDLLIKDNRQLKQENKMLKQENEMLKQENEMLKQENEMLKQDNKQSKQELQNIYIM